ncbi:hypothetical protein ANN_10577 [Periplaneta americana]|uniref:Reverse transcriptase zinc-binding domain-containing protein n=1 Tax=Periplaneta americana TaxID=6978 RepID=A0ABQ8TPR1_PERAM|nr:hypothetical protein ANN_10577 [Periplaneta americana]
MYFTPTLKFQLHTEPRPQIVSSTELLSIVRSRNMFAFSSDERAFNIESYFRTVNILSLSDSKNVWSLNVCTRRIQKLSSSRFSSRSSNSSSFLQTSNYSLIVVYRNLLHVQGQGDDFSFTFFSKWVSITKLENPPDLRCLPSHAPQVRTFKQEISYIPQNIPASVTAKYIYKYMNRSLPAPKIVCRFPVYNWKRIWKNIRNSVLTYKQQDLWFRVVNDIFPTNSKLYNIRLARTSLCPYCQEEDKLQHLFLECPRTKQYWGTAIQDISDMAHIPVKYVDLNFILKPSFYYKPKTTQAAIVKRLALCMETILRSELWNHLLQIIERELILKLTFSKTWISQKEYEIDPYEIEQ